MFTTEQLFTDTCQENVDYVIALLYLSFTKNLKISMSKCQSEKYHHPQGQ